MSQSDFVSRGQALVAAGQYQEAVKVCRLGLLGRPTTVEGRVVLGQALLALKRFDEVLAEMRVALELDHSSVAAQLLRAEALLRKGDTAPAIEELHRARQLAPGEPRILQLLAEAEHGPSRPSVTHPAVGFIGTGDTKHYPGHPSPDDAGFSESFTRPTSLQSPGGARRSSQRQAAMPEPYTPPPDVLAVGDRSGTVEVDPELEGIELSGDVDFDELAAPPQRASATGASRGSVKGARIGSTQAGKQSAKKTPTMQIDPDLDDDIELAETISPQDARVRPSRASEVRNAVNRPSGVIGENSDVNVPPAPRKPPTKSVPPPRSKPPSAAPPPAPLPPAPGGPGPAGHPLAVPAPRPSIGAALPTVAAGQTPYQSPPFPQTSSPFAQTQQPFAVPQPQFPQPPQQQFPPPSGYPSPAAQRPTVALQPSSLNPAQQQSAAAVDQLFGNEGAAPAWARSTVAVNVDPRATAAPNEPTARPGELDPQILALMSGQQPHPVERSLTPEPLGAKKTGIRRERGRLKLLLWILIGVAVIGGGVFAGFWIRAMRLEKQIVAARRTATDLAKGDTWHGWIKARDALARIVNASDTAGNRAALARTRAFIAYEFGDGLAEVKGQVDKLGKSFDANLAIAFVSLSQSDAKAAKQAADAALAVAENDAAAQYAAGNAALLAGDAALAVKYMKGAVDKENRPLYGVGLARAQAAAYNWNDAIAAVDKVLAAAQDQPSAVIARGNILAASGRIAPGSSLGNEVHAQLQRIIAEGKRPLNEQQHGISQWQLAMAYLALARVDFARGDGKAAREEIYAAAQINLDDQRFAEEAIDTLYFTGDLVHARSSADNAMKVYPNSRRVRVSLAQVLLAQGRPNDAIDLLSKQAELLASPHALAIRGQAHLANGDPTSAATDFDAALKKLPGHEPSIIGRAWLELAMGDVEAASKRIAERVNPKGSSLSLTTVYAAILRRSPDTANRDKAKELLEKIVAGPAGLDAARAQLELARIYRDTGKINEARAAFTEASKTGNIEARLESALLMIEDRAPAQGREAIDTLLREAGERNPQLVIEGARARMLDGNHMGASQLLDLADKMSAVERWKLDRERGRLALRKSDFATASTFFLRALDTCGSDAETFLLAADVASAMRTGPLVDKVKRLAPERLKGKPEAFIVDGKLLILAEKVAEAETAYRNAKEALRKEGASARRLAQADFGLALVAYGRANMGEAQRVFEVVRDEDPSIVDVYVFLAEIVKDRKLASNYAEKATQLNPDYPYAWLLAGKFAARMGNKRTLADAIGRLQTIAPNGDELKELKSLR